MLNNSYAYNFLSGEKNELYHFQNVKGNHVVKTSQAPQTAGEM